DAVDIFENLLHSRDQGRRFGAENRFGYRNPKVDALIEAGGDGRSINARRTAYQDAMRLVADDLPVIPLWEVPGVSGARGGIVGSPVAQGWFPAASVQRR